MNKDLFSVYRNSGSGNKMDIGSDSIRRRKRGVTASRVKLEAAMSRVGYKTQASLAIKIAEIEKTESIPKDLVSKVFREVPVSPTSIQRIATALGVEAYTLYLTQQEQNRKFQEESIESAQPFELKAKAKQTKKALFSIAISVIICTVIYIFVTPI